MPDIVALLFLAAVVTVAFSVTGVLIFGSRLPEYGTFLGAVGAQYDALFGQFDSGRMHDANRCVFFCVSFSPPPPLPPSPLFLCLHTCVCVFVCVCCVCKHIYNTMMYRLIGAPFIFTWLAVVVLILKQLLVHIYVFTAPPLINVFSRR